MASFVILAFILIVVFFGKYILAAIAIIAGDKESLHDFGNLCEDEPLNIYWGDAYWRDYGKDFYKPRDEK
jgi:hypothetical protein